MKKLSLLFVFLLLPGIAVLVLESCCPDEKYCISVKEINAGVRDNSGIEPTAIYNGEVLAKAMVLLIQVKEETKMCYNRYIHSTVGNSAYAFKCVRKPTYLDSVIDLTITSDRDFSDVYKAGTNLLPLFNKTDIKRFNEGGNHTLYLLNEPTDTGTHTFTIKLIMADGKELKSSIDPVKLLK